MTAPYYENDGVTLYHGDCLEITGWLAADVLVTDPPYGINDTGGAARGIGGAYATIRNDENVACRDAALTLWGATKPGMTFGSPLVLPPAGVRQVLAWVKPSNMGIFGTVGGFRRDWETIHMFGTWPVVGAPHSGVLQSTTPTHDGSHRHQKPVALMERLIVACPPGVIADPFAGSGSTLVAARNLGRKAIGVEIEEKYCEIIARRLDQQVLPL